MTITGVAIIAAILFLFLKKPVRHKKQMLKDGELETLDGTELEEMEKKHDQTNFCTNTLAIFKLMADKRMIMLYPEILWTGTTLSINSSMLVNLMGDAVKVHGGDEHE